MPYRQNRSRIIDWVQVRTDIFYFIILILVAISIYAAVTAISHINVNIEVVTNSVRSFFQLEQGGKR